MRRDSDYSDDEPRQRPDRQMIGNSSVRSLQQKLCGNIDAKHLSHSAYNNVITSEAKASVPRNLGLTKDTRATVEQVLDPRTMSVLSKMSKRGIFKEFHGCISTGKEANVYHAITSSGEDLAVKVYKTSILVFKDRSAYVEGEFRFRNGYCKSNPRKMVALWAEKELRNLRRLEEAGIDCPRVIEGRQNVVVMSFIGGKSGAAPRLKDAPCDSDWAHIYQDTCLLMRKMFQVCKLVHGDLSEYNLLLRSYASAAQQLTDELPIVADSQATSSGLVVIDVSQSVEQDHPHALDFLKRDCVNVNLFFRKRNIATVGLQRLFEFIIKPEMNQNEALQLLLSQAQHKHDGSSTKHTNGEADDDNDDLEEVHTPVLVDVSDVEDDASDSFTSDSDNSDTETDEVFLRTFIPSTLMQVGDLAKLEQEIDKRSRGEKSICERLLARNVLFVDEEEQEDEDEDDSDDEYGSDVSEFDEKRGNNKSGIPEGISKQEWKKKVKEENREKRKNKIPKKERKKEQKKHSNRK